jgi:hypothetical protein
LLVAAGNPVGIRRLDDLVHRALHIVMASESEPGARHQYIAALEALIGQAQVKSILAHETVTFPGRLGIQHRDVLQAIAGRDADVGIIFHHLARYFAATYPELCAMVTVPGPSGSLRLLRWSRRLILYAHQRPKPFLSSF